MPKEESNTPADWTDKHAPQSFDEMVGNDHAKKTLKGFMMSKSWPHLLLYGPTGVGKTRSAELFAHSFSEAEIRKWNGGQMNGVDAVKNQIVGFASTCSITKLFKIGIIDEFDHLTEPAKKVLRASMDNNIRNCRFILISNEAENELDWIRGRTCPIKFAPVSPEDIFRRLQVIIKKENLSPIITEEQLFKVAGLTGGQVRDAIKLLQGLCSGQTSPLSDEEIYVISEELSATEITEALALALKGNFSSAVDCLNMLVDSGVSPSRILDRILRVISSDTFTEAQKITIGLALPEAGTQDFKISQLYRMLAFIADKRLCTIHKAISSKTKSLDSSKKD